MGIYDIGNSVRASTDGCIRYDFKLNYDHVNIYGEYTRSLKGIKVFGAAFIPVHHANYSR